MSKVPSSPAAIDDSTSDRHERTGKRRHRGAGADEREPPAVGPKSRWVGRLARGGSCAWRRDVGLVTRSCGPPQLGTEASVFAREAELEHRPRSHLAADAQPKPVDQQRLQHPSKLRRGGLRPARCTRRDVEPQRSGPFRGAIDQKPRQIVGAHYQVDERCVVRRETAGQEIEVRKGFVRGSRRLDGSGFELRRQRLHRRSRELLAKQECRCD